MGICEYLWVFVSICEYLWVFVCICGYLCVFVGGGQVLWYLLVVGKVSGLSFLNR